MTPRSTLPLLPVLLAAALIPARSSGAESRAMTLAETVTLAASQAAPARLAGLDEAKAAADANQKRGVLLPQITGSASQMNRTFNPKAEGFDLPGQSGVIGPFDSFDLRAEISQAVLDLPGWMNWKSATSERSAAGADRAHVADEAASVAARAGLMLASASATVAARQADLELAEDLLRLSVARREAGTTAEIDVTRARAQVASARGALVSARNDETQRRVDLCRALSLKPGTALQLTDSLDATFAQVADPGSVDAAIARGLSGRHDLAAAKLRVRSARQAGRAAKAEWIPRLEVVAVAGLSGERADDAESVREVGVRLRWPLADGLAREARIARERANERAAEVSATDATDAIAADVRRAWAALETGHALEQVADERARLAQDEVGQARVRLQEGVAGNLDVIEAQSSLVRARDAIIEARTRSAMARIELARAMGAAQELH